jgi:hypothetical protein
MTIVPRNENLWHLFFYPKSCLAVKTKHPTVCVTCVWVGVDSAWGQRKLEARKMLENAAESPASSVSMKVQPTGCSRARFWICSVCSVNGNAYPGTLRRDQSKRAWEVLFSNQNKPAPVFDCPVRIRLTGNDARTSQPASVCDSAVPKKKRARPLLAGEPALIRSIPL